MESRTADAEFAPSLQYSNNRILSGFPLRVKINPLGPLPTSITTNSSSIDYNMAGTYVDQYLKNTSLDIQYDIPAAAPGTINCVLKQIPIRSITIGSKTGVVLSQMNNLLYFAPAQFYGVNKHVSGNNPHETFGNHEKVIMNANNTPLRVSMTYNLAKCIKSFFDMEVLAPLTEMVVVTLDMARSAEISYTITVPAGTAPNAQADVIARLVANKFQPAALTALVDNTKPNIQIALTEIYDKVNQPLTSQAELALTVAVGNLDINIIKMELYGHYEKSEAVKLMLKGLLNQAEMHGTKMQIPYHNILSQKYLLQGSSGSYSLTHRVTANVGRYLKSLYITFCRATDVEALQRDGSYNVGYFGSWRIQTLLVSRDGDNLVNYDISRNAHEALPYGFSSNNQSDNILENQYFPDRTLATTTHNNGRLRALLKDNFMVPVYFDTASDPMYGKNTSIVAGIPVHGDINFTIDITLVNVGPANNADGDPNNPPNNITCVIFQEGIRYLAIDNSGVGLAANELKPITMVGPAVVA